MEIASFTRVANVAELSGSGPFALAAEGVDLAVVRTENGWRAFEGRCPHLGALLGEGELEEGHLVCRNHRWRFDIASGRRTGGPECLSSCPVIERKGAIYADVSGLRKAADAKPAARKLGDLPGPRPLPLLGNLHQLDPKAVHLDLERWAGRYGPAYAFRLGRRRAVALSGTRLIDRVLRDRPGAFRRPAYLERILSEAGIGGVFSAEGDHWRPQRKLSVAALSHRQLRRVYPHILTVAERAHRRWRALACAGAEIDIVDELKRFTVDVTMLVVFGHDVNTIEHDGDAINQRLSVMLPTISRRLLALVPSWRYLKLPRDRRFDRANADVQVWLAELLAEARKRAAGAQETKTSTFLDAMVQAADENGRAYTDETILSNLFTMVLAGEDTTANSSAWAVHLLADHPEWARRIGAEADSLLGDATAPADIDAANDLVVAAAVANEAMRLQPVVPVMLMEANFDAIVGDVEIPRGTIVVILLRVAALAEDRFAQASDFRPERWLAAQDPPGGAQGGAHDVSAHIPFGSGPRMCPGRTLALVEMNTILAMLYKNFEVERLGRPEDVREVGGFVMSPEGLRVRLRPRT